MAPGMFCQHSVSRAVKQEMLLLAVTTSLFATGRSSGSPDGRLRGVPPWRSRARRRGWS
jgi:hypothetical protein